MPRAKFHQWAPLTASLLLSHHHCIEHLGGSLYHSSSSRSLTTQKRCTISLRPSITSTRIAQLTFALSADSMFLFCSHAWSNVIIGLQYKYPNPHCSHVLSIDVVDRSVDPATGIVRTERILGCKQKTPTWILKASVLFVHTALNPS